MTDQPEQREQPEESEETEETEQPEESGTAAAPVPTAPAPAPQPAETGYTAGGVPTFDAVREKIETRYGTAIGASELAAETPEGRSVDEQYDARQRAAAERLKQIRESMHDDENEKS
ncbi:hypothetical protein [Mycolicibacterium sp. XJ870]